MGHQFLFPTESYDNSHGPSKEAAQLLERRITRAAHAAEEAIESHVVDQIRSGSTLAGKTRTRFLLDVQKVTEDMDYVRRKAIKVKAQSELKLKQPTYSTAATSSTLPISEKNSMVGFDDVMLQLFDLLTGKPSSRRVIPIVGTGGIGKTTLAKNAFEHKLIVECFDVCLWATISQQYVVQDILSKLLFGQGKSNSETVGELEEILHKRLYGRKYLIVLDDMWSVGAWDEMRFFFLDTSNGSRIVVTTRQSDVADHLGPLRLALSFLDGDRSWDLFCEKAFAGQVCPSELEDVGKKIVKKCKGLPLAIVVVGGHLGKSSRTHEYWENVANHMTSILSSEENKQLFNTLSVSYSYLLVHLKPCFIYMGVFPEDEQIYVPDLIKRWIAEGFLKLSKADNLEEIAKGYLKDLIDRNLIFSSTTQHSGKVYLVEIHDLLRELCLKVAKKEMFFYVLDTVGAICRERQVVIKEKIPRSAPLVRCLKWIEGEQSFDLRLLRLLYKDKGVVANEVDGGFLEAADLQQVNLRYLTYYGYYLNNYNPYQYLHLPSSISLFWNLQTLIIGGASRSFIAPYEIWEMPQLRHLNVSYQVHLPDPLPSDFLEQVNDLVMRNLQTLGNVVNFRLNEEVCKRVSNIKELQVTYSYMGRAECDEVRSYCCPHNLGCFRKLDLLVCEFGLGSMWHEFALSLTFPSSLKVLSLSGSRLDWEEMTMMVGSLPHLRSLTLEKNSVVGSEWTLVEGKFLRLTFLTIRDCGELVYWNAESSHFPVLENLLLLRLSRLDEFPSGIGEIPTLQYIGLGDCSVSSTISAVRILVEQEEEQGIEGLRLDVQFRAQEDKISFNKKLQEEGLRSNNFHLLDYHRKTNVSVGTMGKHNLH